MIKLVKNIKETNIEAHKISNTIKAAGSIGKSDTFIKDLFPSLLFILVFIVLIINGLPVVIGGGFIAYIVILNLTGWLTAKRVFTANMGIAPRTKGDLELYQDEQINLVIAGIMKTGLGFKGYEILGRGKNLMPENAMMVTNKRVFFVVVPVNGADKMISGTDVGMWQWLLSANDIKNRLKDMTEKGEIGQVLNSSDANYWIDLDSMEVTFGTDLTQSVCFNSNSEKRCYSIRSKEDFEELKDYFNK